MEPWSPFDQELAETMQSLPPPEPILKAVTPWREAMERILVGLCLTFVTLHFWYLDYLLPTLGTLSIYLGARSLRTANRYFKYFWIISLCKAIFLYCHSILLATPLLEENTSFSVLFGVATTFALFFFLRLGLRQAVREANCPQTRVPVLWAMVWYGVMIFLALMLPEPGWIVTLLMLYAFYRILKALSTVFQDLENSGYGIQAAPLRWSGGKMVWGYLLSLLALILIFSAWSNHLMPPAPEAWRAPEASETTEKLEELGFPSEFLARLPQEELDRLSGADLVWSQTDTQLNPIGVNLQDVQVRIAPQTYRCYHFFTAKTPAVVWQNRIALEPDTSGTVSDPTAWIFWEKRGTAYWAGLPLEPGSALDYFGSSHPQYSALFSYPFLTESRQGAAAYTIRFPQEIDFVSTILRYTMEDWRNFYPWRSLPDQPVHGFFNSQETQSYSTFYTKPEGEEAAS